MAEILQLALTAGSVGGLAFLGVVAYAGWEAWRDRRAARLSRALANRTRRDPFRHIAVGNQTRIDPYA